MHVLLASSFLHLHESPLNQNWSINVVAHSFLSTRRLSGWGWTLISLLVKITSLDDAIFVEIPLSLFLSHHVMLMTHRISKLTENETAAIVFTRSQSSSHLFDFSRWSFSNVHLLICIRKNSILRSEAPFNIQCYLTSRKSRRRSHTKNIISTQ